MEASLSMQLPCPLTTTTTTITTTATLTTTTHHTLTTTIDATRHLPLVDMVAGFGGGASGRDFRGAQWVGRARVRGKHSWQRMMLLTLSIFGLQLVWSTEMSQASPYLLSLGLSKSGMAMVFLAGPLSGLLVQPMIGIYADRCKSRLGRRRPFIIGGCTVTIVSLLLFGWTKEVASLFAKRDSPHHANITVGLAVFSVYAMDFSINAVQAADRSLLVDTLPPCQQPIANAWASRQVGIGAILGFWLSNIDLVTTFPLSLLGSTQLKILSIIAAFTFGLAHVVTCISVEERVLLEDDSDFDEVGRTGSLGALKEIWRVWKSLPNNIKSICQVQFWSWIGWFPILFFSTTWVAEIWFKSIGKGQGLGSADSQATELATRSGSRAMLLHAIVSFASSVILPIFISTSSSSSSSLTATSTTSHQREGSNWSNSRWNPPRPSDSSFVDTILHAVFKLRLLVPTVSPLKSFDLGKLWVTGQVCFGVLMMLTWITHGVTFATIIIGLTGFSWGVSMWCPFALLSEAILNEGGSGKGIAMTSNVARSSTGSLAAPPNGYRPPLTPIMEESSAAVESFALSPRSNDPNHSTLLTPNELEGLGSSSRSRSPYNAATPALTTTSNDASGHLGFTSRREGSDDSFMTPTGYSTPPVGEVVHVRHSDSLDLSDDGVGEDNNDDEESPTERQAILKRIKEEEINDRGVRSVEEEELMREVDDLEGNGEGGGIADSAGVILGIHNIYVVLPQFLVTFLSSMIFAFLAPHRSVVPGHTNVVPGQSSSVTRAGTVTGDMIGTLIRRTLPTTVLLRSELSAVVEDWDAVGIVFRIGGVASFIAAFKCWKSIVVLSTTTTNGSGTWVGRGRYRPVRS